MTEIKTRVELSNIVYEDLVLINHQFGKAVLNKIKETWTFSFKGIMILYYLHAISVFETKGAKLLLEINLSETEKDVLLNLDKYNELLKKYKPVFMGYIKLSGIHQSEDPEDLFNIYTYGGHV